ncbi:Ethanolamine ammonia-lyase small subunit OS=Tsukamurella paurometabola (strain ATCC 8368 / DSM/ CCUG 35730 / CIP 100753 / JCM 10117 / KCTC 9821 / NBRC 16120 / NCIMB 702349 / NCTC 13040) OX=521096 GN=eutC PE=3 SV=1 [Tsukamurella paurometabola]|uniref:Ethanolamine ammonia-lyase small subunit n=1 Tax=Tsukamurella paurometabola (strain ATCC 8368 / DSM 20162 / CCUG 35730 / CIP 100753 / JCM 10117 / KCTC 9821 / NBRC 16120 / NCIMB 702349 / NCTC 13040) TaxID=521096 RepID=D5UMW5_TSUPD|nr:ethanolamine ammonia-lyase subunit EutC [Tsukamurella paurometabola]ADG78462.1 Ethanolamine ammonia-lyase [Tsukamurella paurometabola DSM 20162]SUP31739.1 Ethanolamine ammonia-lyase light chain [Tsukamurella paurometabola]
MTAPHRRDGDFWDALRTTTQSRIGLGRTGDALPTRRVLEFAAAHATARDAVHQPLDIAAFAAAVRDLGLGEPRIVASRAADRGEYLRRPDLGRVPADVSDVQASGADLGIVLADGLSPRALTDHGLALTRAILQALPADIAVATPVIATQARVALGDHIARALGVRSLLVLIGERPGLSVADSLGIYLTHRADPDDFGTGVTDAHRNCISNIHPPEGLGYADAARIAAGLVVGARRLGRSGVDLKDTSRAELPGSSGSAALG